LPALSAGRVFKIGLIPFGRPLGLRLGAIDRIALARFPLAADGVQDDRAATRHFVINGADFQ
jgi:hypothetical protein